MASWLSRLFGGAPAPAARAPATGTARSGQSTDAPATGPASEAVTPVAPGFGVRQPLLDSEGRLAGFEIRMPVHRNLRTPVHDESVAMAARAVALMATARPLLQARQLALISLPLAVAARPSVLAHVPEGVMIALTDGPWRTPESLAALAALRRRGARLGGVGVPMGGGHFVLLSGAQTDVVELAASAQKAKSAMPGIQVVATGVEHIDALEAVLATGVDLAGGQIDRRGDPRQNTPLSPRLKQISALMGRLLSDTELPDLAQALRADVTLSYQLLRHTNSAWMGLSRPAASADDAVMLLGRDGLFRWLSLMLLAGAASRPSSHALQEIALSRARLLETLAQARGEAVTPRYTLGLMSLLNVMLQQPMAQALAPLNLPAPAVQALVDGQGPWADDLLLAQALESGDLERAAILAEGQGGLEAVSAAAEAAWRWAREAHQAHHAGAA